MRRLALLVVLLAAAAVPGVVLAGEIAASDGCLVVQNAKGVVTVNAKGTIVGRFDQGGQVTITDPIAGDGTVRVTGYDEVERLTDTKKRYSGISVVRFRASGRTTIRVEAIGIDLSAVGRGKVTLNGAGFFDPGTFSLDSNSFCQEGFKVVPDLPQTFPLGSTSSG
jgi:hypothetical protein